MGNFNRYNKSDRGDRPQMHEAVCDECGRKCEVPFRPSGDKPIYCSDCFKSKGGNDRRDDRRSSRRDFDSRDSRRTIMHSAVCDKCGQTCEVPFKPTSGKPVYCSNCFDNKGDKRGNSRNNNSSNDNKEQSSKQFKMLNEKLDKVLKILSATGSVVVPKAKSSSEPKKEIKTEKKPEKIKNPIVKKVVVKKDIKKKSAKKKAKAKKKK